MNDYLIHHGILGQKWGVRRFQNPDGSLTAAGARRYNLDSPDQKKAAKGVTRALNDLEKATARNSGEAAREYATVSKLSQKYRKIDSKVNDNLSDRRKSKLVAKRNKIDSELQFHASEFGKFTNRVANGQKKISDLINICEKNGLFNVQSKEKGYDVTSAVSKGRNFARYSLGALGGMTLSTIVIGKQHKVRVGPSSEYLEKLRKETQGDANG